MVFADFCSITERVSTFGAMRRLMLRCLVRVFLPVHGRTPATRQQKSRTGRGLDLPVTLLVSQA